MQITPEVYWQEADFASNIIVSNNIFDSYYSGIVLGIFLDGSYNPGHFQNHINVTISGNIIRVSLVIWQAFLKRPFTAFIRQTCVVWRRAAAGDVQTRGALKIM